MSTAPPLRTGVRQANVDTSTSATRPLHRSRRNGQTPPERETYTQRRALPSLPETGCFSRAPCVFSNHSCFHTAAMVPVAEWYGLAAPSTKRNRMGYRKLIAEQQQRKWEFSAYVLNGMDYESHTALWFQFFLSAVSVDAAVNGERGRAGV
ncbi:unnamed protein product [Pleuronectes platessa]|uniref:Uncharacterized protein n=1 Tax=Pleuronectes platessa TaxID=8262 RepID=A0A9N7TJA0_PLEPL|nr:unnamed protein product [Pleuronectes platessa]